MAAVITLFAYPARADEGVQQMNAANEALLAGRVDEALAQYQIAEQSMPANPSLAYNKGVAFYRQGNFAQALQLFTTALDTDDPQLAAQAAFNLGNCHYAVALDQLETEPGAAVASLQSAIGSYRSALRTDPADRDSRSNIELARRLLQDLQKEEQQKQQPDPQQKQDQQSADSQSDQHQEPGESEQEQSDATESEGQNSQEQKSNDSHADSSQSDQAASQQDSATGDNSENGTEESNSEESDSDESKSQSSTEPDSAKPSEEQPSSEPADQNAASRSDELPPESTEQQSPANGQYQQPEQNPERQTGTQSEPNVQPQPSEQSPNQPDTNSDRQPTPLEMASQDDQQAAGNEMPGYAVSQSEYSGQQLDESEAMKMLQAIRDRDLMRRMKKLNEKRRQYRPVDRDW